MKSSEQLFRTVSRTASQPRQEHLLAGLLPCRLPFSRENSDALTTAQQFCCMELFVDAIRFLTLCITSEPDQSSRQWSLRLAAASIQVQAGQFDNGWHELQKAIAWRNRHEGDSRHSHHLPAITPVEWLIMATVTLAIGDIDTAESYAAECVQRLKNDSSSGVGELLCDTHADALTVLAAIRVAQNRLGDAEMLLQLASDAHRLAGDIEQRIVDLILLSDVEILSASPTTAMPLLLQASRLLAENTDPQRHTRCALLKKAIAAREASMVLPRRADSRKPQCWN